MAKRTSRKQTTKRRASTKARRGPATRTARRRNAARASASRKQRKSPKRARPSTLKSTATAVRGTVAGAVAKVSAHMPWASDQQDAIELLETEHRQLERLLADGEETTERAVRGRAALLDTLTALLERHELIEEKVLYPALQAHPESREIVLEGYQEHHVADLIVKELHAVAKDDEQWGAKFKVLKENIEHHIKEEEGEMFRTARAVLERDELRALGAKMASLRRIARDGQRKSGTARR